MRMILISFALVCFLFSHPSCKCEAKPVMPDYLNLKRKEVQTGKHFEKSTQICRRFGNWLLDGNVLVGKDGRVRTWDSVEQAARELSSGFLNACKADKEISLNLYKSVTDGKIYAANLTIGEKSSVAARMDEYDVVTGGKLVAVLHNHPWLNRDMFVTAGGLAQPSVGDAKVAIGNNKDVVAIECKSLIVNDIGGNPIKDAVRMFLGGETKIMVVDQNGGLSAIDENGHRIPMKLPLNRKLANLIGLDTMGTNSSMFEDILQRDHAAWDPEYSNELKEKLKQRSSDNAKAAKVESARVNSISQDSEGIKPLDSTRAGKETSNHEEKDGTSQIGVKGWCRCKHSDNHVVGTPPVAPYMYSICLKCGKVEKAKEGYKGLMIIDNRYYKGSDRGKADAEQAKLFEIPDGQVVIPGKCACPKPDPITAGPTRVCITCGLTCIP